jgi:Flp pilus assembly protein TadG
MCVSSRGRALSGYSANGNEPSMKRNRREHGSSVIEFSLLAPWILFLVVGTFDLGFFCNSLISVENAARVAAEYTSKSSSVSGAQATACTLVLNELKMLPNLAGVTTCNASPVVVTAQAVTGTDGSPATSVSVTYTGSLLVPIPGLLTGRLNFTRTVQMRVKP